MAPQALATTRTHKIFTAASTRRAKRRPDALRANSPIEGSRRLELSVQLTDSLAEGAGIEDAWALLESVLADTASAALCSHGDVIPDLLRRAQLRGMVIPGKAGCAKGSVWTIDFVDGQPDVGTYSQP